MDTIFALATARGKAGVAIIRVSGPQAFKAAESLAELPNPSRQPSLRSIRGPDGTLIDKGLVLAFEKDASFTGDRVVEFQVHGSPAVVAALLDALADLDGLRLAEPGEFTRRALENGRLDLTQVEGLADLIDAETEAQRRQALRVAEGALQRRADAWRSHLIRAVALMEATIDFADEEVPTDVTPEVSDLLERVAGELEAEVEGSRIAERIRDGFEVAILGKPNIGKSTLLNALAGREAAITSETAGTTRDVIEVRMDLGGLPVTVLDTAGLRDAKDDVERIGIDRARARGEAADLRVFLVADPDEHLSMTRQADDIVVVGKADLYTGDHPAVSGASGFGVSDLVARITGVLEARASIPATAMRARQRISISEALGFISAARVEAEQGESRIEYASENLHRAIHALDVLIGKVDVEHILDEIFSSFCLGK